MDLHLDLDRSDGRTIGMRIEQALREAIRSGRLAPGTRLPSTRDLCVDLEVSRGVVADAYMQLAVGGAAVGLFVVLWLPPTLSEQAVLRSAHTRGLALEGVSGRRPGIVVGYANLSEAAVERAVELLAESVHEASLAPRQNVAS